MKLHGDFNHPENLIITQEDYVKVLNNKQGFLNHVLFLLTSKTFLYIGYSLRDLEIYPINLGGSKEEYSEIIQSALSQIVQCYRLSQQELKETGPGDIVSKIHAIDVKNVPLPTNIKDKHLFLGILQFIVEALRTLSSVISEIQQSKKFYDISNDTVGYRVVKQKFLLYDIIDYIVDGHHPNLDSLQSFSSCKEIMNNNTTIVNCHSSG